MHIFVRGNKCLDFAIRQYLAAVIVIGVVWMTLTSLVDERSSKPFRTANRNLFEHIGAPPDLYAAAISAAVPSTLTRFNSFQ